MNKKAVILLSGGLDSTTCLALAAQEYVVYTLSFCYSQKQSYELEMALYNANKFGSKEHKVAEIDPDFFRISALANPDIIVPKNMNNTSEIPVTYVPARNTLFLSYALAYAEVLGAENIFIGVNSVDYSGYPDCRPEFISAFEKMANLALKATVENKMNIKIQTPLLDLTKAEIILMGKKCGVDYSKTLTCYDPIDNKACGVCDSCLLRKKGFKEANIPDETLYYEN